jgi:hypothetical protein
MFALNTQLSFSECEDLIANASRVSHAQLKIATEIRLSNQPAGAMSLVQAIVTWARKQPSPQLITYADSKDDDAAISNLSSKLHGLVGIMMASDVLSFDMSQSIRVQANQRVRDRVVAMDEGRLHETTKGIGVDLVCIDHSSKAYLGPLYHGPEVQGRLRSETDFQELVHKLIDVSVAEPQRQRISAYDRDSLAGILKELFSNTHEHARRDIDGQPFRKSVRGIHARHLYISSDNIAEQTKGFSSLKNYFELLSRSRQVKRLQLIELAIFDSGPGIAARYLGRNLDSVSMKEEFDAINSCFLKHITTKNRPSFGLGLYRTMSLLRSHNGFFHVRSGRQSLTTDFANVDRVSKEQEVEWGREGTAALGEAAGTCITILLPVGARA